MGEDPEAIAGIEGVAFHDLDPVALDPLEEHELMHAHLADNPGEEGQGKLDHGMEADKAADAGIHFLDGEGGVAAAEGMHPPAGLNRIGHDLGGAADVVHLGLLDAVHDRPGMVKPLRGEIIHAQVWMTIVSLAA